MKVHPPALLAPVHGSLPAPGRRDGAASVVQPE